MDSCGEREREREKVHRTNFVGIQTLASTKGGSCHSTQCHRHQRARDASTFPAPTGSPLSSRLCRGTGKPQTAQLQGRGGNPNRSQKSRCAYCAYHDPCTPRRDNDNNKTRKRGGIGITNRTNNWPSPVTGSCVAPILMMMMMMMTGIPA